MGAQSPTLLRASSCSSSWTDRATDLVFLAALLTTSNTASGLSRSVASSVRSRCAYSESWPKTRTPAAPECHDAGIAVFMMLMISERITKRKKITPNRERTEAGIEALLVTDCSRRL